jgi:hypothetical protein
MHYLLHTYRMYDYLPMNTTDSMVLKIVTEQGPINSHSISVYFDLYLTHIQEILRKLYKNKYIYISEYKPDKRNIMRPCYSAGNKPDAIKPPVKYAAERQRERMLANKQPFTPRRDIASEWMTHL